MVAEMVGTETSVCAVGVGRTRAWSTVVDIDRDEYLLTGNDAARLGDWLIAWHNDCELCGIATLPIDVDFCIVDADANRVLLHNSQGVYARDCAVITSTTWGGNVPIWYGRRVTGQDICLECNENTFQCEECEVRVNRDGGSYCEYCEQSVCGQCYERRHLGCASQPCSYCGSRDCGDDYCGDDDDYDGVCCGTVACADITRLSRERNAQAIDERGPLAYNGSPRPLAVLSVRDALGRTGEPGQIIKSTRAVGIEYETGGGNYDLAYNAFYSRGDLVWMDAVHRDGSGYEWPSLPARGAALEASIADILDILNRAGYHPNCEDGTHCHVDMSNSTAQQFWLSVAALRIIEPVIYSMTERNRRTNGFCRPAAETHRSTIESVVERARAADNTRPCETSTGVGDDVWNPTLRRWDPAPMRPGQGYRISLYVEQDGRYSAINLHAFYEHRTIEVRALDGCNNAKRLTHFAGMIAGVVDFAHTSTPDEIAALIGKPLCLIDAAYARGYISSDVSSMVAFAHVGHPGWDD